MSQLLNQLQSMARPRASHPSSSKYATLSLLGSRPQKINWSRLRKSTGLTETEQQGPTAVSEQSHVLAAIDASSEPKEKYVSKGQEHISAPPPSIEVLKRTLDFHQTPAETQGKGSEPSPKRSRGMLSITSKIIEEIPTMKAKASGTTKEEALIFPSASHEHQDPCNDDYEIGEGYGTDIDTPVHEGELKEESSIDEEWRCNKPDSYCFQSKESTCTFGGEEVPAKQQHLCATSTNPSTAALSNCQNRNENLPISCASSRGQELASSVRCSIMGHRNISR